MRFDTVPVQAVKSISQRNLALHWQALHARSGLPRFADFAPGDRAHDPRQLLLWTVDEQEAAYRYRPLYGGDHVFEAFGPDASIDTLPETLRGVVRTGLEECSASASIIYMSIGTFDPSGRRIECERLLLPFGGGAASVTHILASLQLVSLEGSFERRTVIQQFGQHADVTLCGRIVPASRPMPRAATPRSDRSRNA